MLVKCGSGGSKSLSARTSWNGEEDRLTATHFSQMRCTYTALKSAKCLRSNKNMDQNKQTSLNKCGCER